MKINYGISIIFIFFTAGVCGNNQFKELKAGQATFYLDTIPDGIDEKRIEKHLEKLMALYSKLKDVAPNLKKINVSTIKDTIAITVPNSRSVGYDNLVKLGITGLAFDNNDIIIKLSFYSIGHRNFTREERQAYKRNGKAPTSYATITEVDAIALASKLHLLVYGKEEDEKFDSVTAKPLDQNYVVYFRVKVKNDIRDWRLSQVIINANSGEIQRFSCEGLDKSITYDYVPEIPKNKAIEIFNAETERLRSDIKIKEIYLAKRENAKGEVRWAWQIFGDRQGFMATTDVLYIDSETGEILFNQIGR